jgi:predicted ABC-class ATPase
MSDPGSYKRLQNARFQHSSPDFTLSVNHVQTDAYAPPSRISVSMNWVSLRSQSISDDSVLESLSIALKVNII